MEFIALAGHHRKVIRDEIADYSRTVSRGAHCPHWHRSSSATGSTLSGGPPRSSILGLSSISRFMLIEDRCFGIDIGHAEQLKPWSRPSSVTSKA